MSLFSHTTTVSRLLSTTKIDRFNEMKKDENKLKNVQRCHEKIFIHFKNGQELLNELKGIALQAYQSFTANYPKVDEKELNNELMENGEDKIEQHSDSTDDEEDIGDAGKQRRNALAAIAASSKNLPRTLESEQATKERSERRLNKEKRRAQNSQLVRELRDELEDRPEEIREEYPALGGLDSHQAQARQHYEETNFVRLGMSREERKAAKRRRHNTSVVDELGELLKFGRYKVSTEDENEDKREKSSINRKSNKFGAAKVSSFCKNERIPRKIKRKGCKNVRMKKRTKR